MDGWVWHKSGDQPRRIHLQNISKPQITRQKFYAKVLVGHVVFRDIVQHDYSYKLHKQKHSVNYRKHKIFGRGKFWWTIQVKAIGEEIFGKQTTVSAYAKYIFIVPVYGTEDFSE